MLNKFSSGSMKERISVLFRVMPNFVWDCFHKMVDPITFMTNMTSNHVVPSVSLDFVVDLSPAGSPCWLLAIKGRALIFKCI